MKVKLTELISRLEKDIAYKKELNQSQDINKELTAWISVYRHGSESYKQQAERYLKQFFVNAGYVKGIRSIGGWGMRQIKYRAKVIDPKTDIWIYRQPFQILTYELLEEGEEWT